MTQDRFEIMKLWVPLQRRQSEFPDKENRSVDDIYIITTYAVDNDRTREAWEKATQLAREGWELVGSVPITASEWPTSDPVFGEPTKQISRSFTSGYELLFKRRIQEG